MRLQNSSNTAIVQLARCTLVLPYLTNFSDERGDVLLIHDSLIFFSRRFVKVYYSNVHKLLKFNL